MRMLIYIYCVKDLQSVYVSFKDDFCKDADQKNSFNPMSDFSNLKLLKISNHFSVCLYVCLHMIDMKLDIQVNFSKMKHKKILTYTLKT